MHSTKAPGPDGMSPILYQQYQDVVGKYVTDATLSALTTGILPPSLNHIFLTLIPKRKDLEKVSNYWPISLCNVLYNIVIKVLANRLKLVLPHVISSTQSVFVPDQLITNNVLVAFGLMHYLSREKQDKFNFMSLKLNISKTHYRVDWSILKAVMTRLGFKED